MLTLRRAPGVRSLSAVLEGRSNAVLGFESRHVVPSSSGRRILFGAFEHSVVVRDLVRRTQSVRLGSRLFPFNCTLVFNFASVD